MNRISKQSLKRPALISIVIIVILAIVLGSLFYPNSKRGYTGEIKSVAIGKMPIESHALIYIAEDQGFFAKNGLNVTIRDYNTGPAAVQGLLNNEVDISGAGEYIIVENAFNKKNISIIASIDKYQFFYLVGRKDRGIENVSDLKGQKIGIVQGTQAEFFLGRFLTLHGMSLQDVTRVDVQPSQFVDAIVNGSVDAVIYIRQYDDAIKDRLGSNGVFWPAQSNQLLYSVMVSRNDWATSHPETIRKFLKSLVQAEQYAIDHPVEVNAIIQKRLNYEDAYMETVWKYNQFSLSLDQSLILAMEDEARWMIKNNLTSEKKTPDFLDYIYEDGLKAVKPEAVNIIR